jgi:two-component system OmpR family response regulator
MRDGGAALPGGHGPDGPPSLRLVEADAAFAGRLRAFLAAHGFPCDRDPDADALLDRGGALPARLVLLSGEDLAGPLAALRRLRSACRVPCILIAAGLDEAGGGAARDAGADDAADRASPFPAVLARIRAVLRRAEWGAGPSEAAAVLALDGWRLLAERRQLLRPDGGECPLTTAEFDLVQLLVERRGRPVSRDAIADAVFGRPFRPEDRTVDNLVLRLRRKLDGADPQAIRTVRGAGYMFAGFGRPGADEVRMRAAS